MAIDPVLYRDFIGNLMSAAQRSMARGINTGLTEFYKSMQADVKSGKDIRDAHMKLGELGQQASLNSYSARRAKSEAPEYRVGENRHSGGVLAEAIADPQFYGADDRGISFANIDLLDRMAEHWHRINYSAGGSAKNHKRIPFKVFGRSVGYFTGKNPGNPPWLIPPGSWRNGGVIEEGGLEFYPGKGGLRPVKSTHAPYHFIEAGISAIAGDLDNRYREIMNFWVGRAAAKASRRKS